MDRNRNSAPDIMRGQTTAVTTTISMRESASIAASLDLFKPDVVDVPMPSHDQIFERWWLEYPRKVDKLAARRAFKRVLSKNEATIHQLIAGVRLYAHERRGEDPRYTKHAATWLNAGSWDNEAMAPPPRRLNAADSAVIGMTSGMTAAERDEFFNQLGIET